MDAYSSSDLVTAGAAAGSVLTVYFIIIGVVAVISIAACWKLFSKAGEAGWKSIIPIYNMYILFKIVYGNGLKFLLLLIPILDFIVMIALYFRLAKVYGKGAGFGVLLLLFEPIALPILAFGNSEYQGPVDSFI